MKNEETKEKKIILYQKQKPNAEGKKQTRKKTNQDEKNNKNNTKNLTKNKTSNMNKIETKTTLFSDNNKKKEINESENSFESKMFYEVNNKNNYNFNCPIKTINVYRNNYYNYTNNNIISNLLCDVSDDNKNIMVSELDLNISNSQATPRPDIIQPTQKQKILEKQNTEADFKTQLESNIIKILEKSNKKNNNINIEKNIISNKINDDENKNNKNENEINLNKVNIETNINKEENHIKNIDMKNILSDNNKNINNNNQITNNDHLSKVSNNELKNKYFVSSPKSRKKRGLKSPNINVHKVNSIVSPISKKYINKKIYWNNYTKTDICIKKYKTIIDNNINNNFIKNNNKKINSVIFFNEIKNKNKKNKTQIQTQNTTSKKKVIYNLSNNKIAYSNINYRHYTHKLNEKNKSNKILLTNNSINNLDINSDSVQQNGKMNYSKYKNLLKELQNNLYKRFQPKEEYNSKANSHRNNNKQNETYIIFNLDNCNGRKSLKKSEIFSSNTRNTMNNEHELKNVNNINRKDNLNDIEDSNKNLIAMNHSIQNNLDKKSDVKIISCLTKQNSDINLLHEKENLNKKYFVNNIDTKKKSVLFQKKRPNKNKSCQLVQKSDNILSDSLTNLYHKSNLENSNIKDKKNISLFGIEKINLEINQKTNNSNIEIKPVDLLNLDNKKEEINKNKEIKCNSNINLKKNSDFNVDRNTAKKVKRKNIINHKININSNKNINKYNTNSKNNNNMLDNIIPFRNKFIRKDGSIKMHFSNSKDNKEKENKDNIKYQAHNTSNKKINKNFFNNNNINFNYHYNFNYNHFSPANKVNKTNIVNSNNIKDKNKSNQKIINEGNGINIDINFNNNINYIYIIKTKKKIFKNKSINQLSKMK